MTTSAPVASLPSLDEVWRFIGNAQLSHNQLFELGTRLLGSVMIDSIPPELWLKMFSQIDRIKLLLECRRVCKSWRNHISKFDFSQVSMNWIELQAEKMDPYHLLCLFNFPRFVVSLSSATTPPVSSLTNVRNLHLGTTQAPDWFPFHEISDLTRLSSLSLVGSNLPSSVLLSLTSLQSLHLTGVNNIDSLSSLTNLTSLTVQSWLPSHPSSEDWGLSKLTKLENLTSSDPQHFKNYTGFGTCLFLNGDKYQGTWNQGQRHGKGVLTLVSGTTYSFPC